MPSDRSFAQHLDPGVGPKRILALETTGDPDNTPDLDRVGRLAGRQRVQAGHFTPTFDLR